MSLLLLEMAGVQAPEAKAIEAVVRGATPLPGALPAAVAFLVRVASDFLLGGGVFSTGDWREMHPLERDAAKEAGKQLRAGTALQIGKVVSGPLGAAQVAAVIDDGAALEAVAVQAALDATERKTLSLFRPAAQPAGR